MRCQDRCDMKVQMQNPEISFVPSNLEILEVWKGVAIVLLQHLTRLWHRIEVSSNRSKKVAKM